jgi:hypothetical protein
MPYYPSPAACVIALGILAIAATLAFVFGTEPAARPKPRNRIM